MILSIAIFTNRNILRNNNYISNVYYVGSGNKRCNNTYNFYNTIQDIACIESAQPMNIYVTTKKCYYQFWF